MNDDLITRAHAREHAEWIHHYPAPRKARALDTVLLVVGLALVLFTIYTLLRAL